MTHVFLEDFFEHFFPIVFSVSGHLLLIRVEVLLCFIHLSNILDIWEICWKHLQRYVLYNMHGYRGHMNI